MKLLVIGNATIDRFYRVDRLPVEGESVLATRSAGEPGGKGLNQAVMAARTGALDRLPHHAGQRRCRRPAAIVSGRRGPAGTWLLRHAGESDESLIVVGPAGENLIVTTRSAVSALPQPDVLAALDALEPESLVLLQGNLDVGLTADALARAKAMGHRTLLNPSPVHSGFIDFPAVHRHPHRQCPGGRGLCRSAGARSDHDPGRCRGTPGIGERQPVDRSTSDERRRHDRCW